MKKLYTGAAVALFFLALFKVVYQDLPRIKSCLLKQNDVQPLYLSSRVWLAGGNPYDEVAVAKEMGRANPAGLSLMGGQCEEDCHVYYPPTALPLLAVVSHIPWTPFLASYLMVTVSLYLLCLHRLSLLLAGSSQRLLFWGLGLSFSPFHAGIGTCNISELLIPAMLLSLFTKRGTMLSAVIIGLVLCIKPPLAILLIGYLLLIRLNRQFLAALCIPAIVAPIALLRMHQTNWYASYKLALSHFSPTADGPGGVASHGFVNTGFLNLQALFYMLSGSSKSAVFLDYVCLAFLCIVLIFFIVRLPRHRFGDEQKLLILSILCTLTLFQSTLQYYNGVLLLPAAIYAMRYRNRPAHVLIGASCFSFIVPPRWFVFLRSITHQTSSRALSMAEAPGFAAHTPPSHGLQLLACLPSFIVAGIAVALLLALSGRSANNTWYTGEPT